MQPILLSGREVLQAIGNEIDRVADRTQPCDRHDKSNYDRPYALRVRFGIHGWAFRLSKMPPMATRIMAWETSIRCS